MINEMPEARWRRFDYMWIQEEETVQKYTYKKMSDVSEKGINALAREGWELVGVSGRDYVFKKEAPSLIERFTLEQRRDALSKKKKKATSKKRKCEDKLLNAEIARLIRTIGHTDMLLLADKGFPVPRDVETLDISLTSGIPLIPDVIDAISGGFSFDRIIGATEMKAASPARVKELKRKYRGTPVEFMAHVEFKHVAETCKKAIRTGDDVAYGNIILVCG